MSYWLTNVSFLSPLARPLCRFPQTYSKMACEDNLGRFDLCGILVWDLMHLNTNGFTVRPNGGGIEGLLNPDSIFRHPLEAVRGVNKDISLEETLETYVATQYIEVKSMPLTSCLWEVRPLACVDSRQIRTLYLVA